MNLEFYDEDYGVGSHHCNPCAIWKGARFFRGEVDDLFFAVQGMLISTVSTFSQAAD